MWSSYLQSVLMKENTNSLLPASQCESADYYYWGGALVVERGRKIAWCLYHGKLVCFLQIGRPSSRCNQSRACLLVPFGTSQRVGFYFTRWRKSQIMLETTLPLPVSCAITASKSAILPLPPSLSRPPPAFVCPQPIASSVKNGSVMHLEGDETFIAGLFLFFFFHYGMERARINISMALPAHRVSVWVFSAAFSNGHKCRQVASKWGAGDGAGAEITF